MSAPELAYAGKPFGDRIGIGDIDGYGHGGGAVVLLQCGDLVVKVGAGEIGEGDKRSLGKKFDADAAAYGTG
jgi:hypothetical protein